MTNLMIFYQPDLLKPLIHIKSEVSVFIKMLPPFGDEAYLCVLCLGGKLGQGFEIGRAHV